MLSVFHHWDCRRLIIYGLYYVEVGSFYAHFLKSFNHKWVLNFVKVFLCIYWDDHMVYIFEFVNTVYHIDWFTHIEDSLHPWNKPKLIMVYELIDVFLNSFCLNFVEDFCPHAHQWYWLVVFFSCVAFVWFWYQGNGDLVERVWKCSLLCNFLKEF